MIKVSELEARRLAIRFQRGELAFASDCDQNTVSKVLLGKTGTRVSTLTAMENALIAEEIRLRDYLLSIHPLAEVAGGNAV